MKTVMINIRLGKGYPAPVMTKLKSYYSVVRHYLMTVAINTPVGYIYNPKEGPQLRRKLEDMRRGWVARGGKSEDYGLLWLDVELDDAESHAAVMQSVRTACADVLDDMSVECLKRVRRHAADPNWLDDRRTHKGSDSAYSYILRWYSMFPSELGQALAMLENVSGMLITPGLIGAGIEAIRSTADLLRHPDETKE